VAGSSYVVTGGARGVGRAIAERPAGDGGHVVVVDIVDRLDWISDGVFPYGDQPVSYGRPPGSGVAGCRSLAIG
jgi:NAD(P)-dependent dehydrogenase (short-subunit alcohol dehydrogenase family)